MVCSSYRLEWQVVSFLNAGLLVERQGGRGLCRCCVLAGEGLRLLRWHLDGGVCRDAMDLDVGVPFPVPFP